MYQPLTGTLFTLPVSISYSESSYCLPAIQASSTNLFSQLLTALCSHSEASTTHRDVAPLALHVPQNRAFLYPSYTGEQRV
jgi:hypothetical protein